MHGKREHAIEEFECFLTVEASGWKGDRGSATAVRLDPRALAYFDELVRTWDGDVYVEINSLHVQDVCIAAQFCLRSSEQYTSLKVGYNEEYSRFSPGQQLNRERLERCCADPTIKRLGMVSDESWMHDWRPESVPIQLVAVSTSRAWGRPVVALLRFQWWARRTVRGWLPEDYRRRWGLDRRRVRTPAAAPGGAPAGEGE